MHTTVVKMKDGRSIAAPVELFRPIEGYMTLFGSDEKLMFKDIESAITENERISINKIGDDDLLARARRHMEKARMFGWDGMTPNSPKQEWE
jgi:hypothetical protein